MKRINTFWLLLISITLLVTSASWAIEDAIIAIVNDELLTLKDFKDFLNSMYLKLKTEGHSQAEMEKILQDLQKNGINNLIEDRLILTEANKKGLEINPLFIDQRIDEIKKKYPSEKVFLDILATEGINLTDLREQIRQQLVMNQLLDIEIRSKIIIKPQEITEYYEKHKKDFQEPERVKLHSIFIASEKDSAGAKNKAEEALALLKNNTDFDEVAKKYSEAPPIGVIKKGQLLPVIEEAVFNLSPGEHSSIIDVDTGCYILKVLERMPATQVNLDEVMDLIKKQLFQEKFKERFSQWIADLKKKAFIEVNL